MSDQVWQYLLVTGGALAGTLARIGQWRKLDDSVDWWKAIGELCSIPAIVYLVVGGIDYWLPNLSRPAGAAIAAAVALVGIASVEALILKVLNRKADTV